MITNRGPIECRTFHDQQFRDLLSLDFLGSFFACFSASEEHHPHVPSPWDVGFVSELSHQPGSWYMGEFLSDTYFFLSSVPFCFLLEAAVTD